MSNAVLKGHASGTGTVTIESPNTNSDRTISLPDSNGTVMVSGNMPAFSAYLSSNQTFSNTTFTKIQLNTEEFDTANCYDNSTNYRFTPNIAGYYQVNGSVNITSTSNSEAFLAIYKNGSAFKQGNYITRAAVVSDIGIVASALIYMNGTTDYLELYGWANGTGTLQFVGAQSRTYFQASLVRAA